MSGFYFALFAVPLATLQSLQAGQGIPTGTPGHLLVKTETGQYQILRVGPPGATPAAAAAQQQSAAGARPAATPPAAAAAAPTIRLPTQPVAVSRPPQQQQPSTAATSAAAPAAAASPAVSAAAAAGAGGMGGMGQQMTPDTAKVRIVAMSKLYA